MSPNGAQGRTPVVDTKECTGCEACVGVAPKVFRMNADNISEVFNAGGDTEANIQDAMDGCPASCVHWQ